MGERSYHRTASSARRTRIAAFALGVAALALAGLIVAGGLGEVALYYQTSPQAAGAPSPLRFVDGGNYASASTEGLLTVTFPTSQQVGFSATVRGVDGGYGTYLLDVVELQARTNSSIAWSLSLSVTQAMAATGLNAAYLFYCTSVPTGVPTTGTALASGTDAAGDPWAVYAPTCAGTSVSLPLTSTGAGSSIALAGLTFGTSVLFLSFATDVASGGLGPVTSATVVLSAISP